MKNSSCSLNASASCCIGGRPPSPDEDHPARPQLAVPAERPKLGGRLVSKDHIPTWRTVEGPELDAIFENEVDDGADRVKNVRHRGTAEFREMLGLEGLSDSDKDSIKVKTKKSSSTLKAVTQKLKKHLSRESALNTKRHSRSSVGTSEEEIERRAELRRIRQKRIQEELTLEGIHDEDDAKSDLSVIVSPTPPPTAKKGHSSWTPGSFVPLPLLTPPTLQLPKLSFPHLSPLDKQNNPFADGDLTEGSTTGLTPRRWSDPESSITMMNSDKSERSLSRRYSSPFFSEWEIIKTEPPIYISSRQGSVTLTMPPQPVLQATRLPSIALPARSSWRLSFAGEDRGNTLRKLSQEHPVPNMLDAELSPRPSSPLASRGLHTTGLRLSSQVILSSDDTGNLDCMASHSETCSPDQDFGGVDGSSTTHLHEMGISKRAVSRALQGSSSSPQLSSDSRRRHTSNLSDSTLAHAERSRFMAKTTDSDLSKNIPQGWGQIIPSNASSVYLSANNSPPVSRQSSCFNLLSLWSGSKNKISATEYQEFLPSPTQFSLLGTPATNLSSTSLTIPLTRYPHRSNIDDSSLLASETSSFREREVELKAVQTRFASAEARRVQSSPISSKFREDFSSEIEDGHVHQQRRSSALSKSSKYAIRSYDGAKLEELLDIPVPKFDPSQLRTPSPQTAGLLSPFGPQLDDAAVNVWGKVLKTAKVGDDQSHEGPDYFHSPVPRKKSSLAPRKKSSIEEELPVSVLGNLTQLGRSKKRPPLHAGHSKSAAEEYNERFQERLAVKELVMDSWEEEMAATAAKAKARSRNIVKKTKPTGPDRRYPATWSRYPSHTRIERSVSAGPANNVEVKDFAVLSHQDGEIVWCLEHDDEGHHAEIDDPGLKGVHHRVKERVRHKAYKVDTAHRQAYQTSGRRGSLTVANELEYPELEILPVTLLTAEQMDARHEEEARAAHEKAKDEELDDLMAMFGRADGPSDEGSAFVVAPARDSAIITQKDGNTDVVGQQTVPEAVGSSVESIDKFKTWNGKDYDGYWYGGKRISPDSTLFRKSSEHVSAGEEMNTSEKEEMLKAVKDAWVRGSAYDTE